MEHLDHPQPQQQRLAGTRRQTISFKSTNCFFSYSSRSQRRPTSPPKHASGGVSPCYPITVFYEDKSGKTTPYELVLPAKATIFDVCLLFSLLKQSTNNFLNI